MGARESLLDTFPGRLFIDEMQRFARPVMPEALIEAATRAVARYLYADGCLDVANFDSSDPKLVALDSFYLADLSDLNTFRSPQIHQGMISELRPPRIANREPLGALPDGAFWTSTPISDERDSWTLSGENLRREMPRWEVHFDATRVRLARIDSARDWADLIDSHPAETDGCKCPDWPAIAEVWDAVHLSPAGLLLAHPTVWTTPLRATDGSRGGHSQAGPYSSVADWSAVSTAWLHTPPNPETRPAH